jgi:hypothetical protein
MSGELVGVEVDADQPGGRDVVDVSTPKPVCVDDLLRFTVHCQVPD